MKVDGSVGSKNGREDVSSGQTPNEVFDEWYKLAKVKYVKFGGKGVSMGGSKFSGEVDLDKGKIMLDEI